VLHSDSARDELIDQIRPDPHSSAPIGGAFPPLVLSPELCSI